MGEGLPRGPQNYKINAGINLKNGIEIGEDWPLVSAMDLLIQASPDGLASYQGDERMSFPIILHVPNAATAWEDPAGRG